jgi:copper resistance protein B
MKTLMLTSLAILPLITAEVRADEVEAEIELLELQAGSGDAPVVFDSTFAYRSGPAAALLKLEGGNEQARLDIDEIKASLLSAHEIGAGSTVMAGLRHDFRPGDDLSYGAVAFAQELDDLAEGEVYLFVSQYGDLTGTGELVLSWPLAAGLTLEPRAGFSWSAQRIVEEATGSGVSELEFVVRLRQAIGPILNVYVGAVHKRLVGDTRDLARASGDDWRETRAVIGAGLTF